MQQRHDRGNGRAVAVIVKLLTGKTETHTAARLLTKKQMFKSVQEKDKRVYVGRWTNESREIKLDKCKKNGKDPEKRNCKSRSPDELQAIVRCLRPSVSDPLAKNYVLMAVLRPRNLDSYTGSVALTVVKSSEIPIPRLS